MSDTAKFRPRERRKNVPIDYHFAMAAPKVNKLPCPRSNFKVLSKLHGKGYVIRSRALATFEMFT